MLAIACAAALTVPAPSITLTLVRGGSLPGLETRYWAVEDVTLDSREPDRNFGGMAHLAGGPGRTILIRFGDLNRAIGPGKRVTGASLVLSSAGAGRAVLRSVGELQVPWGEGPIPVLVPWLRTPKPGAPPTDPASAEPTPPWCATWRHRRTGERAIPWQQFGGLGLGDSKPIQSAKATTPAPGVLRIEGLGEAVQRQLERPASNFGFVLAFEEPVEFWSSQAPDARPALELEISDIPGADGPDLSVAVIERTPEYERYGPPAPLAAEQDGVPVYLPGPPANASAKHWPADGEEVTYRARIRNLGNRAVERFTVRWSIRERPGSAVEVAQAVAPGEEASVSVKTSFRATHDDHRTQPVSVEVTAHGDANQANDSLEIHECALNVAVVVAESAAERIRSLSNWIGSKSIEDWAQSQLRFLNDCAFPQSRFSFARDGVLQRIRIQRIVVVPDSRFSEEARLARANLAYDAAIALGPEFRPNVRDADREFFRAIFRALGMSIEAGEQSRAASADGVGLALARRDAFPGLMGYGDTRNDSQVLPQTWMLSEPWADPILDLIPKEHTDLLSATEVGALNANLAHRAGVPGDWLFDVPGLVFVSARDANGLALADANLEFFQTAGWQATATAVFRGKTDANGTLLLAKRPTQAGDAFATITGHTLRPNPFGRLDPAGANSTMLVRATWKGGVDWSALNAWQLVDSSRRNPLGPALAQVRFNITDGEVDQGTNYALGRIVTDSASTLPAGLAPIVDGDPKTSAELPSKAGDWLEIDLGRDRVVAEVRLFGSQDSFWRKFDLMTYATGQAAAEAQIWRSEADWGWTSFNRGDAVQGQAGFRSVSYRAPSRRTRFLRIVCREPGARAHLNEIEVRPLRSGPR